MDDVARVAAGVGLAWGRRGTPVSLLADGAPRRVSWPELSDYLARATPSSVPALGDALPRIEREAAIGVVLCAGDEAGVDAVAAAGARSGGMRAWLLGDGDRDDAERTAAHLRGAGVTVVLVELPLPAPQGRA